MKYGKSRFYCNPDYINTLEIENKINELLK